MSASLRLSAFALVASLLAGCSTSANSGSTTTTTPLLSGNWYFTTLYPGNVPHNIVYAGALSQQGANVTAVLHNSCFSTQDIDLSGTGDTSRNLTLTSNNLASNVVNIKGTVITSGGVVQTSSYTFTVTGSAPCALAAASLSGSLVPSFSGSYAGSLTSTASATANFTLALTQGTANSDGEFPLTGTISASSSSCSVTFPVNLLFAGIGFTANLTSTSTPISTAVFSAGPVTTGSDAGLSNISIAITGCNGGTFSGFLNKQ